MRTAIKIQLKSTLTSKPKSLNSLIPFPNILGISAGASVPSSPTSSKPGEDHAWTSSHSFYYIHFPQKSGESEWGKTRISLRLRQYFKPLTPKYYLFLHGIRGLLYLQNETPEFKMVLSSETVSQGRSQVAKVIK